MDVTLSLVYGGIDSFRQEVEINSGEHPEITEALKRYALSNIDKLRSLIDTPETPLADIEASQLTDLDSAVLLIYYYFSDWVDEDDPMTEFREDGYPCVSVKPEEIGFERSAVLAILDNLPPITSHA